MFKRSEQELRCVREDIAANSLRWFEEKNNQIILSMVSSEPNSKLSSLA
jgi:hypothetical protein